jgi:hypothetical protein
MMKLDQHKIMLTQCLEREIGKINKAENKEGIIKRLDIIVTAMQSGISLLEKEDI